MMMMLTEEMAWRFRGRITEMEEKNERLVSGNKILRQKCDSNEEIIASLETNVERLTKRLELADTAVETLNNVTVENIKWQAEIKRLKDLVSYALFGFLGFVK